ncbi:MAG: transglutaminase domain-containing protein [Eisenbergiella sp.]
MYRLAGYPARYVTGYAAHASDFEQDSDGTYTASVTGADAHAWAEVYMDGRDGFRWK